LSAFVDKFGVFNENKRGIYILQEKIVERMIDMKIKAGSWRLLSAQDKQFILQTVCTLSQYKGKAHSN